jgi:type I restriction enzyme, S subunit
LERRSESVNKVSFEIRPEHFVSLRFTGEIEQRNLHGKTEFKGSLYFAYAGDLIYSKIDVRNGAIGIIPVDVPIAVVTSEFPVYRIEKNVSLPEYIQLVFRTEHFRRIINAMVSGASGRKRVQPDFLENVEIPLPPLIEQNAIVTRWRKAQEDVVAAHKRVEQQKAAIDARFFTDLGLRLPKQDPRPKTFAVWWKDVEKWGVQLVYLNCQRKADSKFRELFLSELCKIGSGGTPSRSNKRYFGGSIPWVKTTEVRNEEIMNTEESITREGLINSSAKVYPKGSLIIAMYGQGATRGRTAKLAIDAATNQACAVLYDIDTQIETDFLWYFLISQYEAIRMLASGNNQPNVNAKMIANLRIPVPPLHKQKQIIERVAAGREEIAREREAADRLAHNINADVEALILGTKKVSEL